MLTYRKARQLAETWVQLITDGQCEIVTVEDKPYGWVFYYQSIDDADGAISTQTAGNAPIIVDRVSGELRVTGSAYPTDYYLKEYEATLPSARLQMAPERHE